DRTVTGVQTCALPISGGIRFSRDGRQVAISAAGAAQPTDVWVAEVSNAKFRQLTFSPHVGIDLKSLVRPELVTFPAKDGLQLSEIGRASCRERVENAV